MRAAALLGFLLLLGQGCAESSVNFSSLSTVALQERYRECKAPGPIETQHGCGDVDIELWRRRMEARREPLTLYRSRWRGRDSAAGPAVCAAAAADVLFLQSMSRDGIPDKGGFCDAGPPRYGWERCGAEDDFDVKSPLVEHGVALMRCQNWEALGNYFAMIDSELNSHYLSARVAAALVQRAGVLPTLVLLDEQEKPLLPL